MRPALGRLLAAGLLAGVLGGAALAQERPAPIVSPIVSIVIDDLGYSPRADRRALALPGPVAVAILPHTSLSHALADEARRAGKEVLLHLPMDPEGETDAGPGRIEFDMSAREIASMFDYNLATVPHAVGVNNHMGSRVTQSASAMQALMRTLAKRGNLFFLDSLTTPNSLAGRIAREHGVPTLERDVFLDAERGEQAVRGGIQRLERLLTARGHAIAIGHPYPETLAALERWLPMAAARGVRLVPLSVMLQRYPKEFDYAQRPAAARPGL